MTSAEPDEGWAVRDHDQFIELVRASRARASSMKTAIRMSCWNLGLFMFATILWWANLILSSLPDGYRSVAIMMLGGLLQIWSIWLFHMVTRGELERLNRPPSLLSLREPRWSLHARRLGRVLQVASLIILAASAIQQGASCVGGVDRVSPHILGEEEGYR